MTFLNIYLFKKTMQFAANIIAVLLLLGLLSSTRIYRLLNVHCV